MNRRRFTACLGMIAVALVPHLRGAPGVFAAEAPPAGEHNLWPGPVERIDADGRIRSWQSAGPLAFGREWPDGRSVTGWRPFWQEWREPSGRRTVEVLYPLFRYTREPQGDHRWSLLQLAQQEQAAAPGAAAVRGFDLWPFWFSRQKGDPATSYRALFPLAGEIKHRFGNDQMHWFLFPLYGHFQSGERVTTTLPWPFVRHFAGGGQSGWSFWPLYGWREQAGESRSRYALWPLVYRQETRLADPVPSVSWGVLPFYAAEHSADADSETWLWPFFGYLHRRAPVTYRETRWFWPFFVQGRGPDRSRERWAPFYTHSLSPSGEKTWVLWPLWREQKWTEGGLAQTKRQLLYFLYWSLEQRRPGAGPAAPAARKTHVWPLYSAWDNGAGRTQVQVLSPCEVFFPHNESIRAAYSPLFALYRFEQQVPGDTRHSLLWDAITLARHGASGRTEFHLGPLLAVHTQPTEQRITLFGGWLGMRRAPGERTWRAFLRSSSPDAAAGTPPSAPLAAGASPLSPAAPAPGAPPSRP